MYNAQVWSPLHYVWFPFSPALTQLSQKIASPPNACRFMMQDVKQYQGLQHCTGLDWFCQLLLFLNGFHF